MIHFIVIAANHGKPAEITATGQAAIVALLEDMGPNSIFVDTFGSELSNDLRQCMQSFSGGFAQRANLLLDSLVSKQRVIKVRVGPRTDGDTHAALVCNDFEAISSIRGTSHLLLGSSCEECESKGQRRASTTVISNYLLSSSLEQMRRAHQVQFFDGDDAITFQNTVIQPMISVAGSISFYDPLVGSKLDRDHAPRPAWNYLLGVKTLLSMVEDARRLSARKRVAVKIVTTLPDPRDFNGSTASLRSAWISELGLPSSFPQLDIEFCYKQAARAIFHQRYLANPRFSLSIDRGLDIVNKNGTLRQCQLDILNERKVIRDIDESEDA